VWQNQKLTHERGGLIAKKKTEREENKKRGHRVRWRVGKAPRIRVSRVVRSKTWDHPPKSELSEPHEWVHAERTGRAGLVRNDSIAGRVKTPPHPAQKKKTTHPPTTPPPPPPQNPPPPPKKPFEAVSRGDEPRRAPERRILQKGPRESPAFPDLIGKGLETRLYPTTSGTSDGSGRELNEIHSPGTCF